MSYKKEITSKQVTWITCYEEMSNEDRGLFFQGYEFNRIRDVYILKHPEFIDKMYNKKSVLENEKAN